MNKTLILLTLILASTTTTADVFVNPQQEVNRDEATFQELNIETWANSSNAPGTLSLTYPTPSMNGSLFLTINSTHAGNTTLKVSVNEYTQTFRKNQFQDTLKVFIPSQFVKQENKIQITPQYEGTGSIQVKNNSKIGVYQAPVIRVKKTATPLHAREGEPITVRVELENTGHAAASLEVSDSIKGLEEHLSVIEGGGRRLIVLQPTEKGEFSYTIDGLKPTQLVLPNPEITFQENPDYKHVDFANAFTQIITITPATPNLAIFTETSKNIIREGKETQDYKLVIKNTGELNVENIRVTLNHSENIQVTPKTSTIPSLRKGESLELNHEVKVLNLGNASISCTIDYSIGNNNYAQFCDDTRLHAQQEDLLTPLMLATMIFIALFITVIVVLKVRIREIEGPDRKKHLPEQKLSDLLSTGKKSPWKKK